jgi:membrane fusion protein, multidrug efflux system
LEETKIGESTPNNNKHKKLGLTILAIVIVIGAVTIFFYLRYKATHLTTDDAFIEGRVHTIGARIKGAIKGVHVSDNQFVKQGDLLVEIDPADYDVKVEQASSGVKAETAKFHEAEARIAVSKTQITEIDASIEMLRANLELQEANFLQAEKDRDRAENLYKSGTIAKERYEKAATAYSVTLAQVKAAREQLKQAEKTLDTQRAIIKQSEAVKVSQISAIREKEARLHEAHLSAGYTKIYAPSGGYITKKSVETGNQIDVGQPLMAVVSLDDIWVTANYKETQLAKVRPGQRVSVRVDAFPGKKFDGKVDSIMSGTGAIFSLFPPENATGNYVKVVQRIPVKIVLDKDTDKDHVLRIGMSVVPTILVE